MSTQTGPVFLDQLFTFLSAEKVDELAKETGFINRKRKITASDFLLLLFQVHGNLIDPSLQELSAKLVTEQEIDVSRAALDKKFTPNAVEFLRRLVDELFHSQPDLQLVRHVLGENWPFTSLRLLDATQAKVPEHLKLRAKKTHQSSVKIQYEFDYLTGQFTFFNVGPSKANDVASGERRIPFLHEKELCVQDLGYFSYKLLEKIQQQNCFFISRFRSDAYLAYENPSPRYHNDGRVVENSLYQKINVVELCRNVPIGEMVEVEGIHFGYWAHFPARCILSGLNTEQKQHRLAHIHRRATKSGKKPKQLVQDLAGLTGYMTNLPESISARQVVALYRLRWQIELSFKALKSFLDLDHFKLVKQERWLCHLFGTFLIFLISQLIAYHFRNTIWEQEEKEISEMVAVRSIACQVLPKLYATFRQKKKTLQVYAPMITRLLLKTARKPNSIKGTALKHLQFA
ncbi:IS4 family transposase [Planomicrobium okeanokoites]